MRLAGVPFGACVTLRSARAGTERRCRPCRHRGRASCCLRNRKADLLRAARSILSQTFHDFGAIVVDEGSTDDTPDTLVRLCEEDPRVRFVRNDVAVGFPALATAGSTPLTAISWRSVTTTTPGCPTRPTTWWRCSDRDPEVGAVSSWHEVLQVESGRAVIYRAPVDLDEHLLLWMNFVGHSPSVCTAGQGSVPTTASTPISPR